MHVFSFLYGHLNDLWLLDCVLIYIVNRDKFAQFFTSTLHQNTHTQNLVYKSHRYKFELNRAHTSQISFPQMININSKFLNSQAHREYIHIFFLFKFNKYFTKSANTCVCLFYNTINNSFYFTCCVLFAKILFAKIDPIHKSQLSSVRVQVQVNIILAVCAWEIQSVVSSIRPNTHTHAFQLIIHL